MSCKSLQIHGSQDPLGETWKQGRCLVYSSITCTLSGYFDNRFIVIYRIRLSSELCNPFGGIRVVACVKR